MGREKAGVDRKSAVTGREKAGVGRGSAGAVESGRFLIPMAHRREGKTSSLPTSPSSSSMTSIRLGVRE